MPRPRRLVLPSVPLHVIQRGNNRIPCFTCRSDYLVYLDILRECAYDCGCALHAYVLMTNHVHLLLSPDDEHGASVLMRRLGQRYVQYFNRRHTRTGTLWEGRFRSCLVLDEDYFLACQRYIELNPVRARMVVKPEHYPWSSYQTNALGHDSPLVKPHLAYLRLHHETITRQAVYRQLCEDALPDQLISEIRGASNGNRPLGTAAPRETTSDSALEQFPKIGL
ncbi:transposase [Massilia sp. CT11-108]|uniref:transposase n=1 Tax=Massilia sp. CT11-108 TaxID=3393900 RepID=UPI0039A74049